MDIAKSTIQLFISRVAKSFISFLAVIIFSRELGASPLGVYYPFIALLGLLAIPANFGISKALEKRISESQDRNSYLGSAILIKFIPVIITVVAIILGRNYLHQYFGTNLAVALVIALIIDQIGSLTLSILRGEMRVGETAIVELLRPLSWLVIGYYLFTQGFKVRALIFGHILGSLLIAVVGWWKVSTAIGKPTLHHIRSLLDYGKYSVVASIGGYFYSWIDVALLSAFVGSGMAVTRTEIGAYENAWRLSLLVILLSQSIATAIFPQFSQWDAEGAHNRMEEIITVALLPSILIAVPSFIGVGILSKDLLSILFGDEFTVAWLVLIILVGEKIFQSVHTVFNEAILALDRPDLAAISITISAITNVMLNVILIPLHGILGAAIATTIAFGLNFVIQTYYLKKYININFPWDKLVWSIFSSVVMGMFIFVFNRLIDIGNIFQLVIIVGFGAFIYLLTSLIYSPLRQDILYLLRSLLSDLFKE